MMEYKGYVAQLEYGDEQATLHGEVVSLRDVVTFEGDSAEEMERAFHASVEDYLAFCESRGEAPETPSGVGRPADGAANPE